MQLILRGGASFIEKVAVRNAAKTVGKNADNIAKDAEHTVVRTTRSGETAARITKSDGSVVDISPTRVKEYAPNTHPNAPPGTLNKVKFPKCPAR